MKTVLILCLGLFFSLNSSALSPYKAIYDFYVKTDIGGLKIGHAEFNLTVDDFGYIYTNKASVSPLWKTLYNYSRSEKSSGIVTSQQLISNFYTLTETKDNVIDKNIEIDISKEQDLLMTGKAKVVDELNVYLTLSKDISNNPNQKIFTYQVASNKGINLQMFSVIANEIVEINGEKLQTIKIACPELRLNLNLSKKYDYLPVLIEKINGNNQFRLALTNYKKPI